VVAPVHNKQIARLIHGHTDGATQLRRRRENIVAVIAGCPCARHCCDDTCCIDPANAVVVRVRNKQIARPIHGHTGGKVQLCIRRQNIVAVIASCPRARDRRDRGGVGTVGAGASSSSLQLDRISPSRPIINTVHPRI